VICESIARDLRLAPDVLPHPRLAPEVVDAEGDEGEEHVDDVDAEQRPAPSVEDEAMRLAAREWRGRVAGPGGGGQRGGGGGEEPGGGGGVVGAVAASSRAQPARVRRRMARASCGRRRAGLPALAALAPPCPHYRGPRPRGAR